MGWRAYGVVCRRVGAALAAGFALATATAASAVTFTYTGAIDTFTATAEGNYQIDAWGAQGGGASIFPGGAGAMVGGVVHLHEGDTLSVVVGGMGWGGGNIAYGGGGASWVYFTSDLDLLLAAGGGGGAGWNGNSGGAGLSGENGGSASAAGGINGSGGSASDGGGGAGWLGAGGGVGGTYAHVLGSGGSSLPTFLGGWTIGCGNSGCSSLDPSQPFDMARCHSGDCYYDRTGGFGGGGGAGWSGGGGGGGYSGGGGGLGDFVGGAGGGGSFIANNFHNVLASSGVRSGNGLVSINLIAVPEPSTWALMLIGFGALGASLRRRRTRHSETSPRPSAVRIFGAIAAAVGVLWGGTASAKIYDATASQSIVTISGPADWYTSRYGRPLGNPLSFTTPESQTVSWYIFGAWSSDISFTFNSALMESSITPAGELLTWDGSGPSPLLAGVFELPVAGISRDLTTATSFSILRYSYGFSADFAGDGWLASVPYYYPSVPGTYLMSDPLDFVPSCNCYSGVRVYQDESYYAGYTRLADETLTARGAGGVPEPSTWALMLFGLGIVGTALRARKPMAVALQ